MRTPREHKGMFYPDMGGEPYYGKYAERAEAMMPALERVRKKRVAIQAGGHIGCVPKLLAGLFQHVYTFEPDISNFACLVRNTERHPNVFAARGALGHLRGPVGLALNSKSSGGHNVHGTGSVPSYRIDDLYLPNCDAILLDVEGYEIHALRGAADTLARCSPLLVIEENKKGHNKGFQLGDVEALLKPYGYSVVERVGEDLVLEAA